MIGKAHRSNGEQKRVTIPHCVVMPFLLSSSRVGRGLFHYRRTTLTLQMFDDLDIRLDPGTQWGDSPITYQSQRWGEIISGDVDSNVVILWLPLSTKLTMSLINKWGEKGYSESSNVFMGKNEDGEGYSHPTGARRSERRLLLLTDCEWQSCCRFFFFLRCPRGSSS